MRHEDLLNKISSLSKEQAVAVEKFIAYLQGQPQQIPSEDFRAILDGFIREHSELLRRLGE